MDVHRVVFWGRNEALQRILPGSDAKNRWSWKFVNPCCSQVVVASLRPQKDNSMYIHPNILIFLTSNIWKQLNCTASLVSSRCLSNVSTLRYMATMEDFHHVTINLYDLTFLPSLTLLYICLLPKHWFSALLGLKFWRWCTVAGEDLCAEVQFNWYSIISVNKLYA